MATPSMRASGAARRLLGLLFVAHAHAYASTTHSSAAHSSTVRRVPRPVLIARPAVADIDVDEVSRVVKELVESAGTPSVAPPSIHVDEHEHEDDYCATAGVRCASPLPEWMRKLSELEERGAASVVLLAATALSLGLANGAATSAAWLRFWTLPVGPRIGAHALSVQGWINEGLMALFFFVVGLEIKLELREGSLSTPRKALLPCLAALGGMLVPMAVYALVQLLVPGGGSLAALTVPMATDIAFALAILSFFRDRMPASATTFLLTLATVDDLGAILVLALFASSSISPPFLAAAAAAAAAVAALGRSRSTDARLFGLGGAALWYCLLRGGINADIAGVVAGLSVSTKAELFTRAEGSGKGGGGKGSGKGGGAKKEKLGARLVARLSPLCAFVVMPLFALANTAVKLPALTAGGSSGSAAVGRSVGPALGVLAGLVLGKPLGILSFSWMASSLGLARYPAGLTSAHTAIVGLLGGIGFTMCLLLCETTLPGGAATQALPKLAVLVGSASAAVVAALAMRSLPPLATGTGTGTSMAEAEAEAVKHAHAHAHAHAHEHAHAHAHAPRSPVGPVMRLLELKRHSQPAARAASEEGSPALCSSRALFTGPVA